MDSNIRRIVADTQMSARMRKTVCEEMRHGIEVSNLARMIGEEMGQSAEICDKLEVAGVLHDIGKLKLTKYLYDEDGLMVEQMKYVRQHTGLSCEIVRGAGLEEDIARAVYYHHENYDGSGYPDNLRQGDIPLMARILRVCDVFMALITDRSYRKAFDAKTALEIMIDEVEDYDMQVFLAFQRVIHREGLIEQADDFFREVKSQRQIETLSFFEKELGLLLAET